MYIYSEFNDRYGRQSSYWLMFQSILLFALCFRLIHRINCINPNTFHSNFVVHYNTVIIQISLDCRRSGLRLLSSSFIFCFIVFMAVFHASCGKRVDHGSMRSTHLNHIIHNSYYTVEFFACQFFVSLSRKYS